MRVIAIQEIRKARNMTQADLAALLQVSPATISRYESGERIPDIKTAAKIAAALGCKVDDLIKED